MTRSFIIGELHNAKFHSVPNAPSEYTRVIKAASDGGYQTRQYAIVGRTWENMRVALFTKDMRTDADWQSSDRGTQKLYTFEQFYAWLKQNEHAAAKSVTRGAAVKQS